MAGYFDYYVGADFGQANDFTALAVVEEPVWAPAHPSAVDGWAGLRTMDPRLIHQYRSENYNNGRPPWPPLYLRYLTRIRHVSYAKIVELIDGLLARPPLQTASVCLVVDYTGVGRGVMDWLVAAGMRPLGVTITGGNEVHYEPENDRVTCPKRDLVVATQAAIQNGRLRMARGLAFAETLTGELKNYRVKISASGHDSYDAREGEHDDLVLGTALAVWWRDWFNANMEAHYAELWSGRGMVPAL